jgi:L-ascorbate metabolism protein UlaG (beta-lactamase superfamily)
MTFSLQVTYVGHATVLIEIDGVRLLTDPLLRDWIGPLRRRGAKPNLARCQSADAVLISHMHWDHLDLPSLRLLDRTTRLIVPRGAVQMLRQQGFQRVEGMHAGDTAIVEPLEITATYAKHSGARYPLGPIADCLGFVIRGRYRVYFAGDTGLFPEMAALSDDLDVALLPVWGWGPRLRGHHLDPLHAAQSLTLLRPRLAVPIHWGTFYPLGMGWMRPRFLTSPPQAFARHAACVAPKVKVRILAPGESLRLQGDSMDEA